MLFRMICGQMGSFGTRKSHYGSLMGEYNSLRVSGGYIWLNGTQLRSVGLSSDR